VFVDGVRWEQERGVFYPIAPASAGSHEVVVRVLNNAMGHMGQSRGDSFSHAVHGPVHVEHMHRTPGDAASLQCYQEIAPL
jgi:hypothetical protein